MMIIEGEMPKKAMGMSHAASLDDQNLWRMITSGFVKQSSLNNLNINLLSQYENNHTTRKP